ncbi:MAG: alpha/beta fold hydrolase [Actinobacteria bacterium]|nr:alpha/beta fold hydrolase [Actinomycetota bacterium]
MPEIDLGDICLHYGTWPTERSQDREVVHLVHGLGAPRLRWPQELVDALVDRGFDVVAHDNRDSGRSTVLHDRRMGGGAVRRLLEGGDVDLPYTLADMAADVVRLWDHLGVERAHVVGASMGGMIAQHVAMAYPHRTRSLTSVMSTTGARDVGHPTEEATKVLLTPLPADDLDEYLAAAMASRRVIESPDYFDEGEMREHLLALWEHGVHPEGTVRQFLAILADGDRTERLRAIEVPTLVIHGVLDPLIDKSGGVATAEAIPGAELLLLDGMAHDIPVPLVPQVAGAIADHARAASSAHA